VRAPWGVSWRRMMAMRLSRRAFVQAATAVAAAVPLGVPAEGPPGPPTPLGPARETLPLGRIGPVEFSRLILGGNLIAGYAHARDLTYVSQLMKRYNTPDKVAATLELAETHGITALNCPVGDGIPFLEAHWKRGGKMKWMAQASPTQDDLLVQFRKAIDLGAAAIHIQGHSAENMARAGDLDQIGAIVDFVRANKVVAGVAAHAQRVIVECVRAKIKADFYQKTLHTHEYHTAPRPGESGDLGRFDNSWCKDPEEVVDFMYGVEKPWIAFKVLAAGAIPPRQGIQYAFDSGADFILLGMFDWQVAEDVRITKEVLANLNRKRPWRG
jgi:hypothetical protein